MQDQVAEQQPDDRRHVGVRPDPRLGTDADQPDHGHHGEDGRSGEPAALLEPPGQAAQHQHTDNDHGQQDRLVGEAKGLLAEVHQGGGPQGTVAVDTDPRDVF